jgi:hypothetical protein
MHNEHPSFIKIQLGVPMTQHYAQLYNAIALFSRCLYEASTGQQGKGQFAPNRTEQALLKKMIPRKPVEDSWMSRHPVPFLTSIQDIADELKTAAMEPGRLGGYFCNMGHRAGWTSKPRFIAQEMNVSRLFASTIYPADVVKAQQMLGVWGHRKNIEKWERAIK